jgi:hypothetical protein
VKIYNFAFLFCIISTNIFSAVESIENSSGVNVFPANIGSYRAKIVVAGNVSPTKGVYKLEKISGLTEAQCDSQGMRMYIGSITATADYDGCYKFAF